VGRLRWLNGRRAADEAWDAYEAPDGAPLLHVCASPHPWPVVQHWVADLARELRAAEADGSMPLLALDRVWITRDSRALLLDFPAPGRGGSTGAGAGEEPGGPQRFLARVAAHALGAAGDPKGGAVPPHGPLPRHARATLDALERGAFASVAAAAERTAAWAVAPDHVTRARRAASILLANVPLAFALLALAVGLPTAVRLLDTDFLTMSKALLGVRALGAKADSASVAQREALERYLVDRFGATLADSRTWSDPRTAGLLTPLRPVAVRVLAGRRSADDEERRAAAALAEAYLGKPTSIRRQAARVAAFLPALVLLVTAGIAVLSAWLFRGGLLLRLLGLAVVRPAGTDVSRVRAAWRAVVAWCPVLLLWLYIWIWSLGAREAMDALSNWVVPAAALAVAVAGCVWAIFHPERGLAERLSGTYLVPR
jgi:hypothetical protein